MSGNQGYQQLYYSPTYGLMTKASDWSGQDLVWVLEGSGRTSLRHILEMGPGSNPPLPDDAVALVPVSEITEFYLTWDGVGREGPLPDSTFTTRREAQEWADKRWRNLPGIRVEERKVAPGVIA